MMVNTDILVPMTDANQNFSKVVRMVDEGGMAVILKNNKPKYVVVDFSEYDSIAAAIQLRNQRIEAVADEILEENMETFTELAK
ncbi:MAG: type II toxin-antitoxin system Phd/YefM family antitoxin [Clostridia bacterium]|nr:type II toxin-antitoxin system Phd/YefM family antitoxin [Clostridia bacterium]MBQ7044731.1 type II toxin-antitoxin system Phd/YefM family antitoxin [Clostridia bacterium]